MFYIESLRDSGYNEVKQRKISQINGISSNNNREILSLQKQLIRTMVDTISEYISNQEYIQLDIIEDKITCKYTQSNNQIKFN